MERLEEFLDFKTLATKVVGYLPDVLAALLILLLGWLLFQLVRRPLQLTLARMEVQEEIRVLLVDRLLRYVALLASLVMAADQLGFNIATALAGLGVAGIALGFAAQDSVANMIAGILIFVDKPFAVGDWIETESEFGQVSEITLRSTRIRTVRNTFVVIPNKRIIDATLENYSKQGAMRIDVPLGIAYKEDLAQAREVLLKAVTDIPDLSPHQESAVVFTELGDSSVNLEIRVWVEDGKDKPAVYVAVIEAAKLALDAARIQIPFPHLQLFVDDVEERVWEGMAGLQSRGGTLKPGGSA